MRCVDTAVLHVAPSNDLDALDWFTEETHMADRYPNPDEDTGLGANRESTTSTPRWGLVMAIVFILLIVVLHLTGILGPGLH